MKKIIKLNVAIILSTVLLLIAGCASAPVDPNADPTAVTEATRKASIVMKSTARSAVYYAASKDKNTTAYANLFVAALNKFLQADDLSPSELSLALRGVPIKELKSIEAQLAINTLEMTYELFWGELLRAQVRDNVQAVAVLTSLRDGVVLGQADVAANPPPLSQ